MSKEYKCVLLTGGNAAGKTTALRAAQARHADLLGWRWVYADFEMKGPVGEQFRQLNRLWGDPTIQGLAIEGVRIYNTVFRCAMFSVLKRQLWIGLLLQDYEVGRTHVQQRCAEVGKRYRASFWDQGEKAVGHLFKSRYTGGVAKFLREDGRRVAVQEVKEFLVDQDYWRLEDVGQWIDQVLAAEPRGRRQDDGVKPDENNHRGQAAQGPERGTCSIVQVLGTNGSGKSALLRALARRDPAARCENGFTLVPGSRFVLVGDYLSPDINTPGVDGLHNKAEYLGYLAAAATWVHQQSPPWAIAWEGIIIQTRQYHPEYARLGLEPLYVLMDTPLDTCFARIEQRSGRTRAQLKDNGRIVEGRASGVARLAQWFEGQGAEVVRLNGLNDPAASAVRVIREVWRLRG